MNKKQWFLIIFVLVINSLAFCQCDFQLLIKTPLDEITVSSVEINNHSIIFIAMQKDIDNEIYSSKLIKLNNIGEITKEHEFTNQDGSCALFGMQKYRENEIITVGAWTNDGEQTKLWCVKFDTSLNIIADYKIQTNFTNIGTCKIIINQYNNFIIAGTATIDYDSFLFLYELNHDGTVVRDSVHSESIIPMFWDIYQEPGLSGYKLLAYGYSNFSNSPCTMITSDTCFNFIRYDSVPENMDFYANAGVIDNNHIVICGDWHISFSNIRDIGIIMLDSLNNILYQNSIGKTDTLDYAGYYDGLDFISTDNIFVGGTSNQNMGTFVNVHSWFILGNFTSELQNRWTKYYGGDAYYNLWSITATSDGGCLLLGTRYDYATQDNERDIFIIKVDENGFVTSVKNNPGIMVKEALLYPNPGANTLYIQTTLKNATLEMYDANGRMVVQQNINETTTVNTSALNMGMYFYRVMQNGAVKESGKWVKQQ
jgi:hypothetical protein